MSSLLKRVLLEPSVISMGNRMAASEVRGTTPMELDQRAVLAVRDKARAGIHALDSITEGPVSQIDSVLSRSSQAAVYQGFAARYASNPSAAFGSAPR
ncbi:MAG: hypothetical protein AAFQ82_23785, partial [Myxococcota bacterium]